MEKKNGFSLPGAIIILFIILILAMTVGPILMQRLEQSDALTNLAKIVKAEEEYKTEHGVYLECAPEVPCNKTYTWSGKAPGFKELGVDLGDGSYEYQVAVSENKKSFTATAIQHTDEDEHISSFKVTNGYPIIVRF